MEAQILAVLDGKTLSVAEIVEAIGTGDRCKKAAQALVRRRLEFMVAKSLIRRESGDGVWLFSIGRTSAVPAGIDGLREFAEKLPPPSPDWSPELEQLWLQALRPVVKMFHIEIEILARRESRTS